MKTRELEAKLAEMMGWEIRELMIVDLIGGPLSEKCKRDFYYKDENLDLNLLRNFLSDPAADLEVFQWVCDNWDIKLVAQYFKNLVDLLGSLEGWDTFKEFKHPHIALMRNYKIGMWSKAAALTHSIIKSVEEVRDE